MLGLIWSVSISLALVSLFVMVILIIRRLVLEWIEAREAVERKALRMALIRFGADEDHGALISELRKISLRVVADAGFEYLAVVRGDERDQIEAVFNEIGVPQLIRRQLRRGSRPVRIYAAERLAAFPGKETEEALLKALGDRFREVRIASAISLGELDRLPPLRRVLARIGPRGLRSRRIIEVFQTVKPERAGELREVAADIQTYPLLRASAISAIGQTGDYDHIGFLQECSRDQSPDIAAAAINALGRLAHPSSEKAIVAGLDNPDWQVRSEAAQAAGVIGLSSVQDKLMSMLDDEEWTVRYWAANALRRFGAEGVERLRTISSGGSSRSQRTASMVLAEFS